jgi:hypothetical protein
MSCYSTHSVCMEVPAVRHSSPLFTLGLGVMGGVMGMVWGVANFTALLFPLGGTLRLCLHKPFAGMDEPYC